MGADQGKGLRDDGYKRCSSQCRAALRGMSR